MWFKHFSILATIVTVAGCQSLPQPAEKKIPEKPTQSDKEQKTPLGSQFTLMTAKKFNVRRL